MSTKPKILITGATGLIGKELYAPLQETEFDIYALTIDKPHPPFDYHWVDANLFDEHHIAEIMEQLRPTHLLNLAWATTGDYLKSDINYSFLSAGINLARAFAKNGGQRAVFAGSCFEYKFKDTPLKETDDLDVGKTTYTFCKNTLREVAKRIFDAAGVGFAYGRIFYVYGHGEAPTRLTASVISKIRNGERVEIKAGPLKKDYIYTRDIANAFVALTTSNVVGPVNLCTGKAISIRDYVTTIANKLGRPELLDFSDDFGKQPPLIVGDNTRLIKEVGYQPRYNLEQALSKILKDN